MREYVRGPIWASAADADSLRGKIADASATWPVLERESVRLRQRDSCLLAVPYCELPSLSRWAVDNRLELVVLTEQPLGAAYSNATPTAGSLGVRVALTRFSRSWTEAWDRNDDEAIGELLGFPSCCRAFFRDTWQIAGVRDSARAQAHGATVVGGNPGTNVLLRQLGVRLVPHLPCSYSCTASAAIAEAMIGVAVQLGLGSGAAAAVELLSLPALYSAYHGLAYVRARGFQFEFSTDYTPGEVRFSWQPSAELTVPKIEPTPYADNGFSSYNAMAAAHATVLSACGQTNGTVIDLGCGDGTLLSKLWIRNSLLKCIGVESDKERAARGARRHPAVDFLVGKLEAFPIDAWGADAALLMPGRLLEIRADEFAPLLTRLRGIKKLIVYTYAGEDLGTLCSKSGLPLPSMLVKSGTTEAGVISWH